MQRGNYLPSWGHHENERLTQTAILQVVDLAIKHQSAGVVALDLCGNPAKGDVRIFTPAFARAKAAGLKITLHFAETTASATDLELQTLLSWQPNRLGHVIHVPENVRAQIEKANIGVELCLSCNVHAKLITGTYSDHHFGVWRHSNVPLALCVRFSSSQNYWKIPKLPILHLNSLIICPVICACD